MKFKEYVHSDEESLLMENLTEYFGLFLNEYGPAITQCLIRFWNAVYSYSTLFNLAVIFLKYIPTGIYMYKFTKSIYIMYKDRIKRNRMELEEIQLQIQIAATRLSVRDGECEELQQRVRRGVRRLRAVRRRVRDVLARAPESEFLMTVLKDIKDDSELAPEKAEGLESGEQIPTKTDTPDSVYSTNSDNDDLKKECRLKIIKVTNVYKVAYLKHYIKQKRMRRANRQASFKKKVEGIKQLLEDWQKTLNTVINTKLTLLNLEPHPIDVSSQEAMGDYSKADLNSDSDSDIHNSNSDTFMDEYGTSWAQNAYKSYPYDELMGAEERNYIDNQEFGDNIGNSDTSQNSCCASKQLFVLREETNSEMAIEDVKYENEDQCECQDLVIL